MSKEVPPEVKNSEFGCRNCLWSCIECKQGSMYKVKYDLIRDYKGNYHNSCENYTYYD
jgi:hypothetical protein